MGTDPEFCRTGRALHRHFPELQPRPPERRAGRLDGALHSGTCDVTISIDCDGQDDINAMDEMVKKYLDGAEVVYGVRSRRDTDTFFKRFTAEAFIM